MKKNTIKFKDLQETNTIQIIDMDDYFGSGMPIISNPMSMLQFFKKYLKEIIDCNLEDGEDCDAIEAFKLLDGDCDGDSAKVYITIVDGAAKVIVA